MKVRITPCTECRKNRRKCIRDNWSDPCARCEKFGKLCVQAEKKAKYSYSDDEDNDHNMIDLKNEVQQLEQSLQQLEIQLKSLEAQNNPDKNITFNTLSTNTTVGNLFCQWKFKIKNGFFQIDTNIRKVSDLLSVTYLSPLSGYINANSNLYADGDDSSSETTDSYCGSRLILNFSPNEKEGAFINALRSVVRSLKKNEPHARKSRSDTLMLPKSFLLDPISVMKQLINVYFKCNNLCRPLLHEVTFRDRFAEIEDPLCDLLSLSVCSNVCSSVCEHLPYDTYTKRDMADFFYSKAKLILLDQFDQADKRFENVMSISLLIQYMHVTLQFFDSRRWIHISYQICLDLEKEYNTDRRQKGPDFSFYSATQEEELTNDVHKALFARHVTNIMWERQMMDFIANEGSFDLSFFYLDWKYLADEPEITKRFVQSENWLISLINHPFYNNFMKNTCNLHVGKTCTLSFESIVRLEDVIKEWAKTLPAELRLCDDLKDTEKCREAMNGETDFIVLLTFIQFHLVIVSTYSCLLKPITLGANEQILSYVQHYSLNQIIHSCRLLFYASHKVSLTEKNEPTCKYETVISNFIFPALDVLGFLALSPNAHIAKEAREMLRKCINIIDNLTFMQKPYVPYAGNRETSNVSGILDGGVINLDHYNQYSHPWLALIYDASHFIPSI
ncbi:MAG: hypothetical protein EXX96DRAFT_616559 [Benjaminiella poitrasii]|nr:MAG: hypothetical protein EXX96DRAFT_616559 [Benjaminiella poitrasii]